MLVFARDASGSFQSEHLLHLAPPVSCRRPVIDGRRGIGGVPKVLPQDAAVTARFHKLPSMRMAHPVRTGLPDALRRLRIALAFHGGRTREQRRLHELVDPVGRERAHDVCEPGQQGHVGRHLR